MHQFELQRCFAGDEIFVVRVEIESVHEKAFNGLILIIVSQNALLIRKSQRINVNSGVMYVILSANC